MSVYYGRSGLDAHYRDPGAAGPVARRPCAEEITIEYAGKEAGPEARYLEAWLESSLPDHDVGLKGNRERR